MLFMLKPASPIEPTVRILAGQQVPIERAGCSTAKERGAMFQPNLTLSFPFMNELQKVLEPKQTWEGDTANTNFTKRVSDQTKEDGSLPRFSVSFCI